MWTPGHVTRATEAPMETIITKKCTKCGEVKPLIDFFNDKKAKDGKTNWCKVCSSEQLKKWRREHEEQRKAQGRRAYYAHREDRIKRVMKWAKENKEKHDKWVNNWHLAHKEKGIEANRKSAKKYPDRQRTKTRKYRAEHPEWAILQVEKRRARKLAGGGDISAKEWKELKEKYGNKCLCCGRTDVRLTLDHVIPLSLGGLHNIENAQPLCLSCNSQKHTKEIDYRPF